MPYQTKDKKVELSKKEHEMLYRYLENANANSISDGIWVGKWSATHGETRSTSTITFHIGFRLTNGHYWSCILVGSKSKNPLKGTEVDWGTTEPYPPEVVEYYRAMFSIEPADIKLQFHPRRDDDNDGGAGPSGYGGSGEQAKRQVYQDAYNGYFYYDSNGGCHACDASGRDIGLYYGKTF
ncbi:hypothetical protein SPI_03398 [Niveomyces insectorum RCEF 264]|uniref:Uncharacterized protein n=1 Tax=Niveomyces insectorum RCEF 264 TaxID=1081102 RepID=A0A167XB49_9HYPO|nr:hypothetical protein SPI_03398 [Niveomyces insectorum RCEF 264]